MHPQPLPPELEGAAFTILGGTRAGMTKSRMLGRSLHRPTYGVRRDGPPETLTDLAAATALALPADVAFCYATAAAILGLPLPTDPHPPLHVMRTSDHTRIRRRGCIGHVGLERREVVVHSGLTVVSAADTWIDMAGLPLDDLVALGDAIATREQSTEGLVEATGRHERVPRPARQALGLVRVGSASPMESRARLAFHRAGLPEPELNAPVTDDAGEWLATGDFVWRRQRVVVEYQGAYHFGDADQGQRDISRRLLADDLGWRLMEITKHDLDDPGRRQRMLTRLARWLGE